LPSDLTAPLSAFPDQPSDLLLPPPRNPVDRGRSNKIQDDRRNWMMMTPAEIFGVTPTEQMLKPAERDAFGREKKAVTTGAFPRPGKSESNRGDQQLA